MIRSAISDEDIITCYEVMSELRPHLQKDTFLEQIREMEKEGFRMAFVEDDGDIVAVAGYRIFNSLFMGKNLYVDDLVTSAVRRSSGFGSQLMDWLRKLAKTEGCQYLHLDSGTQREQAHKFYFREGMTISSFHFAESLSETRVT